MSGQLEMFDEMPPQEATAPVEPSSVPTDKPNRLRRSLFVIVTFTVAYLSSMYLALHGTPSDIGAKVAEALTSYMNMIGLAYVGAHSLDRSEILTKVGEAFTNRTRV